MVKAICIPYHRYQPHVGDAWRIYLEVLGSSLRRFAEFFDTLYILDSDACLSESDFEGWPVEVKIITKTKEGHHWVQYKQALPKIDADYCLFVDNDVLFLDDGSTIKNWFEMSKSCDLVTAFDGSGGLKDLVQENFPLLKEVDATRMGSYYFVANRKVMELMKQHTMAPYQYPKGFKIPELDYSTKEGDWSDSFGYLTIKLLAEKIKVMGIDDPRESIYLEDDGSISRAGKPSSHGYYHIRNGNLPIYLLGTRESDQESYQHCLKITPRRELLRLMAWFDCLQKDLELNYQAKVSGVLRDVEISQKEWDEYVNLFRDFHGL